MPFGNRGGERWTAEFHKCDAKRSWTFKAEVDTDVSVIWRSIWETDRSARWSFRGACGFLVCWEESGSGYFHGKRYAVLVRILFWSMEGQKNSQKKQKENENIPCISTFNVVKYQGITHGRRTGLQCTDWCGAAWMTYPEVITIKGGN